MRRSLYGSILIYIYSKTPSYSIPIPYFWQQKTWGFAMDFHKAVLLSEVCQGGSNSQASTDHGLRGCGHVETLPGTKHRRCVLWVLENPHRCDNPIVSRGLLHGSNYSRFDMGTTMIRNRCWTKRWEFQRVICWGIYVISTLCSKILRLRPWGLGGDVAFLVVLWWTRDRLHDKPRYSPTRRLQQKHFWVLTPETAADLVQKGRKRAVFGAFW